ncbi:citrate lyase holo-[acyl-carrier protein] synthase [Sporomusa malonica]|uniref:Probable 2-(5''-triphosphoribosyl)-3'-dephosphocoenzyme-A synthase n=1 Tax=Sporomusa malonica TaxID=112901 RepID=A0A1W2C1E9_9FIRM|nr:citrate lyase holo-[acyl-carrier protein] synthase [Sporomusa malonica]SMC78901.1 holo-ACP synthase / triphosphoribosyl-dephospho-CoA synthase [Sporomusa malonica]
MKQITLEAVLAAKERLASLQAELRNNYELPVVSFTTNIPGPAKDSPGIQKLLQTAVESFRAISRDNNFSIVEERFIYPSTGPAAVVAVAGEPDKLKQACILIEESSFHARLFDIDVFDAAGRQLSRTSLGRSERTCFLCSQPAVLCRRLGKHSSEEIARNVAARQQEFTAASTILWPGPVWNIGSWAVEAMLMEAACTPAPGLVDRDNAGAHQDMDFFTFLMSSSALAGSMFRCAAAGYSHEGLPQDLLAVLRYIGKDGEQQMLAATGGVNTQKGLLFLLGILAAAAAYTQRSSTATADHILDTAAAMTSGIVARELTPLLSAQAPVKLTAGEKLYVKYGITGIRGEVEAGIPSIRVYGLPALKAALGQDLSLNDALVHTLMSLMTVVQDTTILNRHGMEILLDVQNHAKSVMENGGMLSDTGKAQIIALDHTFIKHNISPGGVADLLAATYFLYLVENNNKIN